MDVKKIKDLQKFYHETLFNDVLPFWLNSDLIDKEYGGFITSVDRQGKSYNSDKSVWFQGRCLWTFSKLCNTYGVKEEWVRAAESGARFIKQHCIDSDGRMFFTVTREGKPLRKRRYFFSESFLVVGFAEYYLLTKNAADLDLAVKYFDFMWNMYCNPESDPFKITPKENAEIRSLRSNANPMVLVSCAQTLKRITKKDEYYDGIINKIIDDMLGLHYKENLKCVLETVYTDGSILDNPVGRTVNPGHSIENSWFLMNYAMQTNNKELLKKALNVLDWSLDIGWDKDFGGIYYFRDAYGRPCEQLEHDMKLWWVHNEALIATLVALNQTEDKKYEAWYDKLHDYAFGHFCDHEHGEWFGYLHRDGTVSHEQKGSLWKGPYHLLRCLILCDSLLTAWANGEKLPALL
ncbi:MAG: N-acylglucosamine 2-epimerase [Clostridiales bacterium]|nr:N-acylglucosamine 2-epimerase [Clostridiales bacterium]